MVNYYPSYRGFTTEANHLTTSLLLLISALFTKNWQYVWYIQVTYFFYLLFCCPTPNLLRGQPHSPMLLTTFVKFRSTVHRKPRDEVGFLSPVEYLVGLEPGTFQFLSQRINLLGHSLQMT